MPVPRAGKHCTGSRPTAVTSSFKRKIQSGQSGCRVVKKVRHFERFGRRTHPSQPLGECLLKTCPGFSVAFLMAPLKMPKRPIILSLAQASNNKSPLFTSQRKRVCVMSSHGGEALLPTGISAQKRGRG